MVPVDHKTTDPVLSPDIQHTARSDLDNTLSDMIFAYILYYTYSCQFGGHAVKLKTPFFLTKHQHCYLAVMKLKKSVSAMTFDSAF